MELNKLSAATVTDSPETKENSNHGRARPTAISNTLLPNEEETALSPKKQKHTIQDYKSLD
jgi:hypothetical protein